ncbi:MAG: hypothetical protein HKM92_00645, partial [Arenibacter sp.]|nr:hypothetical protein [Arenibacter sp.]
MEKITFVKFRKLVIRYISLITVFFVFIIGSGFKGVPMTFSSVNSGEEMGVVVIKFPGLEHHLSEKESYLSSFQIGYSVVDANIKMEAGKNGVSFVPPVDTDGDGVTDEKEIEDGTD